LRFSTILDLWGNTIIAEVKAGTLNGVLPEAYHGLAITRLCACIARFKEKSAALPATNPEVTASSGIPYSGICIPKRLEFEAAL
jgi:hypothetical protein